MKKFKLKIIIQYQDKLSISFAEKLYIVLINIFYYIIFKLFYIFGELSELNFLKLKMLLFLLNNNIFNIYPIVK